MKRQFIAPIIALAAIFAVFFAGGALLVPAGVKITAAGGQADVSQAWNEGALCEIPAAAWRVQTGADGARVYRLTVITGAGNGGIMVASGLNGPDIYADGAGESSPNPENRSAYGASGYTAYFFTGNDKAEIALSYGADDLSAPTAFIGPQAAVIRALYAAMSYYMVCIGCCLFAAMASLCLFGIADRHMRRVFAALLAFSAAIWFLFGQSGVCSVFFPYLSAAAALKISRAALIAGAACFALFSGKLFAKALNRWVVLAFSIYCAVCAAVLVIAPVSAHTSIMRVFGACFAAFSGYAFIVMLAGGDGGTATLWTFSAAMLTALTVWRLTSPNLSLNYINAGIMTLIITAPICQWSPRASAARRLSQPADDGTLTEAGRIAGRVGDLKAELYSGLPDEIKALAGDEREYAAKPPRRPVGLSDDETLIRDLKNITTESNRLGLLAARVLQALAAADSPLVIKKVQLVKCAEKSYDLYSTMFDDNNNSVTLETDAWLPFVGGDENLIIQCIQRLFKNINARTLNGTVEVFVKRGEDRQSVEFITHDDGDVIPADLLAMLFSGEAPADPAASDLGAARNVIESMGGALRVKSTLRDGTTLSFALPDFREPDEGEDVF